MHRLFFVFTYLLLTITLTSVAQNREIKPAAATIASKSLTVDASLKKGPETTIGYAAFLGQGTPRTFSVTDTASSDTGWVFGTDFLGSFASAQGYYFYEERPIGYNSYHITDVLLWVNEKKNRVPDYNPYLIVSLHKLDDTSEYYQPYEINGIPDTNFFSIKTPGTVLAWDTIAWDSIYASDNSGTLTSLTFNEPIWIHAHDYAVVVDYASFVVVNTTDSLNASIGFVGSDDGVAEDGSYQFYSYPSSFFVWVYTDSTKHWGDTTYYYTDSVLNSMMVGYVIYDSVLNPMNANPYIYTDSVLNPMDTNVQYLMTDSALIPDGGSYFYTDSIENPNNTTNAYIHIDSIANPGGSTPYIYTDSLYNTDVSSAYLYTDSILNPFDPSIYYTYDSTEIEVIVGFWVNFEDVYSGLDGNRIAYWPVYDDIYLSYEEKAYINGVKMDASPNPARDFITIRFELEKNSTANLKVYDLRGTIVYQKEYKNLAALEPHTEQISLEGLSNGIYYYSIDSENGPRTTKKFIRY